MKKAIHLIFPHQLFAESAILHPRNEIYLVEEYLFFRQYSFHKQKIAFHRASMKYYQRYLEEKDLKVNYVDSHDPLSDVRLLIKELRNQGYSSFNCIDPTDNWLKKRIRESTESCELNFYESPLFINSKEEIATFFHNEKNFFFQTAFYKQQRVRLNVLIDENKNPLGGKWTYDTENRKKYPSGKIPPGIVYPRSSPVWEEAVQYVELYFNKNPGEISKNPIYPTNHREAYEWFQNFLKCRFFDFGIYEDAILKKEHFLNHSVLSPLLNVGLLEPLKVIDQCIHFANHAKIPLNSTEGFIRQIIGWREFIRGMYEYKGSQSRTLNFWGFHRKIPSSFYDGTTGILPVDQTIKKVLNTGYCHHIERLMILGNFMLLCEFDPDAVYQWFMELFIDAYDWVMVPNVYGMSQYSDGGFFATKPYIGGSNYIRKMSDYPRGDWGKIWDGLFWRFIHKHQSFFKENPRTSMLYHSYTRMSPEKRSVHLNISKTFIDKIEKKGISRSKKT